MICNVLEYLEKSVDYPKKTALSDEEKSVSYEELLLKSKQIGSFIASKGLGTKKPIAVYIDRNVESVMSFYGIVYSGNFYVPVDPTMPAKRIELIFDTLQPVMVINAQKRKLPQISNDIEVVSFEDAVSSKIDEGLLKEIRANSLDTDPLYGIFTSGSTGVPKGVLICHRSVVDLCEQFAKTFPYPEDPSFGNQAPLDFDVSVKDLYGSLKLGGCVHMIPKKLFSMPGNLIPYLNERKVNVIIWAVSAVRIVSDFKILDTMLPEYLKLVMFSGEVMPVKTLKDWMSHLKDTTFVNLYGPTEITCNCTYYIVDRDFEADEKLPIGKSFKNTEVFLLDEENNKITKSEKIGEICVRGTCLAHGYYNNPEKTKEAFTQNPLNKAYPELIYRTGDLGYYSKTFELYFSSRKDYQIKHMGHRIELGEIEVSVNAIDFIDVGVCIYDDEREKIVLCYQSEEECDKAIVKELSRALPKFMWPNEYRHYPKLPLNKNGKIDRVYLREEIRNGIN